MSGLGFHITIGNHGSGDEGLGAILKRCAEAGSPVSVMFGLDQNEWPTIQQNSPTTQYIFRTQPSGYDNPPGIYTGDAAAVANDWYAQSKPKWLLNKAHYYAPCNERNPVIVEARKVLQAKSLSVQQRVAIMQRAMNTPLEQSQHEWLNTFDLRMMELAEADGFKLALHGDSVGTPEYSAWAHYATSLSRAAANGHILILHEYGLDGTLQGSAPHLALRYREVHRLIEPFAPGLKMAITEASADAGYSAGDDTRWLNDAFWYDGQLMADRVYMMGACLYQLGGAENFYRLLPQLGDYISTHPTPIDPPPPADEWVLSHYLINGLTYQQVPFDFTMGAQDSTIEFVFVKKATGETYSLTVKATPAELINRVLQSPSGTVFKVGDVIHFDVKAA